MIKSNVCEKQDLKLLKNWLGFKPKKLKLLYRVSEDGDGMAKLREKCKNLENILVFIRSNLGKRFGGHRKIAFGSNGYKSDYKAFLFSFTYKKKLALKLNKVANSIYDSGNYGPTWGSGHDLYICNNCTTSTSSYSNLYNAYDHPNH